MGQSPSRARSSDHPLLVLDALAARALRRLAGSRRVRVAIFSGRPLDSLLDVCRSLDGVYLVAEHGAVIRDPDGRLIHCEPSVDVSVREAANRECAGFLRGIDGLRLAVRPGGIVLGLRTVEPARRSALAEVFRWIATKHGAAVIEGRHWLEARFVADTKGAALSWLMGDTPDDAVVYAGDDPTDDTAMSIARRAPLSLVFHVRSHERPVARKVVDAVLPDRVRWGEILRELANAADARAITHHAS